MLRHVAGVRRLGGALLALVLAVLVASSSGAATTRGIGVFTAPVGGPGAFTTTMQLPGTGYPVARVSTDASSATLASGSSTWFGATTPPGEVFGSSRDLGYLNLTPRANNAASPSVTTYAFDGAVPVGWGFVLGDIDSDKVQVSATLADGSAAGTEQLGFRGVFNPCDSAPKPSGCSTSDPKDVPTWDPASATLTGNPTGTNTYGASGWFVPTVPLRTLTLRFTWRTGLPIYQAWFGAVARDVTGVVAVTGSCDVTATTVRLLGADGQVLATTRPADDGSYRFDRVAATDQFRVSLADAPDSCEAVGPVDRSIDLRTQDAVADFAVRALPTSVVSGEVTQQGSDDPVPGAEVTITGPDDLEETVRSGEDGTYALPPVTPGTYEVAVDPPPGFQPVGEATQEVVVPAQGGPIDLDFVLVPVSTSVVSGEVSEQGSGDPVAGAEVTITGPGGVEDSVTSGGDGRYTLPAVEPGTYDVTVDPPPGFKPVGEATQEVVVPAQGGPIDLDFVLVPVATTPTPTPAPATSSPPETGPAGPAQTSPVSSTGGTTTSELPDTGGPDSGWLSGGVGLLLAGCVLLVAGRRSRPRC